MKDAVVKGLRYLITQVIVPNLIWTALLGIPGAVIAIKYIVAGCQELATTGNISLRTFVIAAICVVVCFLSLLATVAHFFYQSYLNKQRRQEAHQAPAFPPIRTGYAIVSSEIELYFKDREHISQRQKITYRVEEENVDAIEHTIQWTGESRPQNRLKKESFRKGYRLEETRVGNTVNVRVLLPEKKNPGFSDTYTLETEVLDTGHQMAPALARRIISPTELLRLKVTVPEGLIQDCERLVSVDFPPRYLLSEPTPVEAERFGDNLCYQYGLEHPELLRHYSLRWTFIEDPPADTQENQEKSDA